MGLIVSGMANPEKVLGFLDIAGLWDPSLAFVMGGAIIVGLVSLAVARKRTLSFLGFNMKLPTNNRIEKRMVIGSMMFGIGRALPVSAGPRTCGTGRRRNQGRRVRCFYGGRHGAVRVVRAQSCRGDSETDREFAGSDAA